MIMAAANAASAGVSLLSGIGAQKSAQLEAFNIGTERILARTEAMQQAKLRDEGFREALAASNAFFFAAAGREETADIRAFKEKERIKSGEDISNIELMSFINQLKYGQEQAQVKRKGRESLIKGIVQAGSYAAKGYQQYDKAR